MGGHMNTQRKLLIRLLAVAVALLATITWVDVAEASTTYTASTTTASTTTATSTDTTTLVPVSKPVYTLFSVGWGGGQ